MPKPSLFCFFSGYSHQDAEILSREDNEETITLKCLNLGENQVNINNYIQLDGIIFLITNTDDTTFTAVTTLDLIENTTMKNKNRGDLLMLGIEIEKDLNHSEFWSLHPSASGQVTYCSQNTQPSHRHTLEFHFTAEERLGSTIKDNVHIGLNGASLTARNVRIDNGLVYFSIFVGRDAREHSSLNDSLEAGTRFNLNSPGEVLNSM